MSSTRFQPDVSSSGRGLYVQVWYSVFYMHQYKQSCTYKTAYADACTTHYTIPVYTTLFLKMIPQVQNV